jgi:tetratricopeptide (TPR) repeat protein
MTQVCKSCGAAPPPSTSHVAFVCEYCGTKNVNDQYFIERAKNIDASKSNRHFGLGVVAFNSGDYQTAEKQFEQAVQEDDLSTDSWIYLAHTKAKTIKPSNFSRHIAVAINCINKAKEIDPNAEIVEYGSAAIANSFLAESNKAAQYYFDTAEKKLIAFGKNGSHEAASEAALGLSLIKNAFDLNPNDTKLAAESSIYAMYQIFRFDDLRINSKQIKDYEIYFLEAFYKIYVSHKEKALEVLTDYPRYKGRISTLLEKRGKSATGVSSNITDPKEEISDGSGSITKKIFVGVGMAVILSSIIMFERRNDGPKTISLATLPSPTATAEKNPVKIAQDSPKCVDINSCILASMQDAERGDFEGVRTAAAVIETLPKPDLGNRAASRKLNSQGLDVFKQENFPEAIEFFRQAMNENPKDVEVVGNLGYAFLKNNQPKEAVEHLSKALLLGPKRTATWAPLAESYALLDQEEYANAALSIGYFWSNDREKSKKIYQEQLEKNSESNPKIAKIYETILKNIGNSN